MAKIGDVKKSVNSFFNDVEYIALGDLIGQPISLIDWEIFENKDGVESVALKFAKNGLMGRTVTHSKAIIDLLRQDDIDSLKGAEPLDGTIVERKSKKTGRTFITIE